MKTLAMVMVSVLAAATPMYMAHADDALPTPVLQMPAQAQQAQNAIASATESRTPLVIIRFTQRTLDFKKSLGNAIASATATKPDVAFDVVLFPAAPGSLLPGEAPDANLQRVLAAMRDFGVPSSRTTYRQAQSSSQRYDEVYVYVR